MKVCVVGGTGNISTSIVRILVEKGHEVVCFNRGLRAQPWVKTSLGPGSMAVTRYLERAGLIEPLQALGFHVTGYGCTVCIGNKGVSNRVSTVEHTPPAALAT